VQVKFADLRAPISQVDLSHLHLLRPAIELLTSMPINLFCAWSTVGKDWCGKDWCCLRWIYPV